MAISTKIKIREVEKHEIKTLQKISRITFSEAFAEDNNPQDMADYIAESFSYEKMELEYQNLESQFFFAELDGEIMGYLKLNWGKAQTEDKLTNALEVERIYVLSPFYGKGIGQLLYDKALSIAKNRGFNEIWLGVWGKNYRAIRFYQKNGFTEFGTHTFKLGDDIQTDLLMKLVL